MTGACSCKTWSGGKYYTSKAVSVPRTNDASLALQLPAHLEHPTVLQLGLGEAFGFVVLVSFFFVMKSSFPVTEELLSKSSFSGIALIWFLRSKHNINQK